MKTAIAWRYRTKTSLAPKRGYASCESKKCLPKGRQRAFHLLLKVSHIEEMLEAPLASTLRMRTAISSGQRVGVRVCVSLAFIVVLPDI